MACRLHMYYRLVPAELAPSDAQGEMVLVDTEGFQELPPQPHLHQQPLVLWLSSWQKDLGPSLHTGCSCSRSSSAVQQTVLATERNQPAQIWHEIQGQSLDVLGWLPLLSKAVLYEEWQGLDFYLAPDFLLSSSSKQPQWETFSFHSWTLIGSTLLWEQLCLVNKSLETANLLPHTISPASHQ